MNKKEAVTQLEIMATNATGRLGEAKSEEEKALLNKQIEALNMGIDALKDYKPKTGRWIPCEERMPDDVEGSYGCIATVMNTDIRTGEEVEVLLPYPVGYDGKIWIDDEGCECPYEVIAWMPLPKPYEDGKE